VCSSDLPKTPKPLAILFSLVLIKCTIEALLTLKSFPQSTDSLGRRRDRRIMSAGIRGALACMRWGKDRDRYLMLLLLGRKRMMLA
jgi:hypothetical protein